MIALDHLVVLGFPEAIGRHPHTDERGDPEQNLRDVIGRPKREHGGGYAEGGRSFWEPHIAQVKSAMVASPAQSRSCVLRRAIQSIGAITCPMIVYARRRVAAGFRSNGEQKSNCFTILFYNRL